MESKVGNALTDDLYDLFTGPAYEAYRQYDQFEKCAKCELLRFCRGLPGGGRRLLRQPLCPRPQCWKEVLRDATRDGNHPPPPVHPAVCP